jgi:hypothetical protein
MKFKAGDKVRVKMWNKSDSVDWLDSKVGCIGIYHSKNIGKDAIPHAVVLKEFQDTPVNFYDEEIELIDNQMLFSFMYDE